MTVLYPITLRVFGPIHDTDIAPITSAIRHSIRQALCLSKDTTWDIHIDMDTDGNRFGMDWVDAAGLSQLAKRIIENVITYILSQYEIHGVVPPDPYCKDT